MLGVPVRGLVVVGVLATAGVMYVANDGKPMDVDEVVGTGCRVTVTADILNVRAGPDDTQPIVSTMRRDAVTPAQRTVVNGFRLLSDGKWVREEFVTPTSDSSCT